MNKPLIITIAIGILLLALGSWVYLFLFGAPQTPDEVFTDLGITPISDENISLNATGTTELPALDLTGAAFQQLTLRPVAGYVPRSANQVVYMEKGTGHLFSIDTSTSQETRLTNTTIPVATTGYLNADASAMVVVRGLPGERAVLIGQRTGDTLDQTSLPPTAENFIFTSTSTLVYTVADQSGSRGYEYNLATDTQRELFVVPFSDIDVHITSNAVYVSNQPATGLEGALYEVRGTTLTPVSNPHFGFVALVTDSQYARSSVREGQLQSVIASLTNTETTLIAPVVVPEKCTWRDATLLCASPFTVDTPNYIENWYQGVVRSNDVLWQIDPNTGGAQMLDNPETVLGRPLDMERLSRTAAGELFFINRLDNSLWRYVERTQE
ncbi:MAG TPA: hypothetical protein VKP88_00860 [Candidatus Paceibacterota bacterium]|nr:hypothetical protein [Candidatus Paceibacterota bacterium]